jgi:hypothetical protein
MIVINELKKLKKNAVVAYFKLLSGGFLEEQSVSGPLDCDVVSTRSH